MKLVLIFLFLCSLSLTNQQAGRYYFVEPYLAFYYPIQAQPFRPVSNFTFNCNFAINLSRKNLQDIEGEGDAESRSFIGHGASSGEKRFLGLTINLPPKTVQSYYYERKTRTSYFTVSSTATVAQFKSCINSAQFVTSGGKVFTDLCSRKRREAAEMTDLLIEATTVLPP